MSTYGELYEDAMAETWAAELYEEHATQAREEFRAERLTSYYATHRQLAVPAYLALADARALQSVSTAAAVVRAATAAEVGIKEVLLHPIVHGLVHSESLADAVTDLAMGHQALSQYRKLLIQILEEYGGIDLAVFRRTGATEPILKEFQRTRDVRNGVVHRGDIPSENEAAHAISVASVILDEIVPKVVLEFGFHFHGAQLCNDSHANEELDRLVAEHQARQKSGRGPITGS